MLIMDIVKLYIGDDGMFKHIYNLKGEYIDSVYDFVEDVAIKREYPNTIISNVHYNNPIVDEKTGQLREKTKLELYNDRLYKLGYNEIFEDGNIKTVDLDRYHHIENNQVVFNKNELLNEIKDKIHRKEQIEKEKEFEFKGYMQPNRELQDQTSLLKVISLLNATQQTEFKDWKMYDDKGQEHYVTLTIQEMMKLAYIMQQQTTIAMRIGSKLREKVESITDEKELMDFSVEKEWASNNEDNKN